MTPMFRIHVLTAFLLVFPFISAEAQKDEIKTVAILGDSYSTFDGYIPEGNACWYFTTPQGENDVVAVEQTWWHQFCREGGYELVLNESYSGATVCNTGYDGADYSDRAFITRMFNVTALNPDLIIIFGATNDSWANVPLGELQFGGWSSSDMYSFLPACCFMLEYFSVAAPQSQVVFVINSELKEEITAGITEACDHYGFQSLLLKDIHKLWGHPSIKGMSQISEQLSGFVRSLK